MTDNEFLAWSLGHKPFYNEWEIASNDVAFRQHLMRYFVDLEVTREELEDLTLSSRNDASVAVDNVQGAQDRPSDRRRCACSSRRGHHHMV